MIGGTLDEARDAWTGRGFTGFFSPSSGFDDDTVTAQSTNPTSTPESTCIPLTSTILVTSETAEGCPSGEVRIPLLTGQTVGEARDDWEDSVFTGGFSPNGQHNQWATAQNPAVGVCAALTVAMTVTPGSPPPPAQCTAPNFVGRSTNEAPGLWAGANFTGTIDYRNTTPFIVGQQNLVGGQLYDCTSDVDLRK